MNEVPSKTFSILVVDDESEVLEQVAEVLAAANLTSHCCTTAEAGVASAETNPPDLIISDINLQADSIS